MTVVLLVAFLFTGCGKTKKELEQVMNFRAQLLSHSCSFRTEISADYDDETYIFGMECEGDSSGNLIFSVTSPESISDIRGSVINQTGKLKFEDVILDFPLMANDRLSPVCAPWIFLKTLQGGYVTAIGTDGNLIRLTIKDSYEDNSLQLDIWINQDSIPEKADILFEGTRILSLTVENFQIM